MAGRNMPSNVLMDKDKPASNDRRIIEKELADLKERLTPEDYDRIEQMTTGYWNWYYVVRK